MELKPIKPLTGMNSDIHPKFQPPESYRYALNIVRTYLQSLENEEGNLLCGTSPILSSNVIGATYLQEDEFLVFIYDPSSLHTIALYNTKTCNITPLIQHADLNFNLSKIVTGLFRIFNGCDRLIYFTDGHNPYRVVNIDKLGQYQDSGGNWVIDRLDLTSPVNSIPQFESASVIDGGGSGIDVGSVFFGIQYTDEFGNNTNIVRFSRSVPIYTDSTSASYHEIKGSETGETTTKSVRLELSNLDTTFDSFRIIGFHKAQGTDSITSVNISPSEPITGTTATTIYKGATGASSTSVADALTDNIIIDVVQAHEQKDNRLHLANHNTSTLDYGVIQQAANQIVVTYHENQLNLNMDDIDTGAKGPNYYFTAQTFARDEVYAFGIQGILSKGQRTPVFHIPGRERLANNATYVINSAGHRTNPPGGEPEWDFQLLTVVASGANTTTEVNLADVKHLGFTAVGDDPFGLGAGQVYRWQVFNTYAVDGVSFGDDRFLGYYQTQTRYPSNVDCDGNFIYPVDPNDPLQTDFIRHHRIPDAPDHMPWIPGAAGAANDATMTTIGLRFNLTAFLAALPTEITDAVQEWEIVQAERTDANKTVLDNGNILAMPEETDLVANPQGPTVFYDDIWWVDAPQVQLNNNFITPTHIKLNRLLSYDRQDAATATAGDNNGLLAHQSAQLQEPLSSLNEDYHRSVTDTLVMDSAPGLYKNGQPQGSGMVQGTINGTIVRNNWASVGRYLISLADPLTVHGNSYSRTVPPADVRQPYYVAFKRYNPNAYSNLSTLVYHPILNEPVASGVTYYAGDHFVSRWVYEEMLSHRIEDPFQTYVEYTLNDRFVESEINAGLQTQAADNTKPIFDFSDNAIDFLDRVLIDSTGTTQDQYKEQFGYNLDYSPGPSEKPYFPLSNLYDYCSNCQEEYPYRWRYSNQSFQESITDHYRVFEPLNYQDILGSTGPITDLFRYRDNMFCTTERGIFFQNISPQTIQTDTSNFVLGNASVFSIPPRRLTTANHSYGGQLDQASRVATPYGVVYADIKSSKLFLVTETLQEISLNGVFKFIKDNLKFRLQDQFYSTFGIGKVYNSVLHPQGVGVTACYDPYNERYLLRFKDYTYDSLAGITTVDATADGQIGYDPETGLIGLVVSNEIVSTEVNISPIRDRSWTLSFHLPTKTFSSFHSYLPTLLFNDDVTYFSVNDTENIWKHNNQLAYQTFYNTKYDSVIDYIPVVAPGNVRVTDGLSLSATFSNYDPTTEQFEKDDTTFFSFLTAYNSYQHTGKVVPSKNDPFNFVAIQPQWDNVEERYTINTLRDYSISAGPVFSQAWADIQADYPIDKVINPANLDLTKTMFETARLRDEYMGLRLFFNPVTNTRFSLDLSHPNDRISYK